MSRPIPPRSTAAARCNPRLISAHRSPPDGVHAFHECVRGRELVIAPLRQQRYGDWELDVRDPNGYVLVFGGA